MVELGYFFRGYGEVYDGSVETVINLFTDASIMNSESTMKVLILHPVIRVHHPNLMESFLQILCGRNYPNIRTAELLISFKINLNSQNAEGDTALHLNAMFYEGKDVEKSNVTKLLLKGGANPDIINNTGLKPVQLSLLRGKLEIAEEYLKEEDKLFNVAKADRTKRCQHLVKCFLQEKSDWNFPSTNYSILLHFLVLEKDEETFEYVAKNTKFSVNAVNDRGHMLLHLVAQKGTCQMIRTLINMGADPDADSVFGTPLAIAIRNCREVFDCLLDCGASVNKIYQFAGHVNMIESINDRTELEPKKSNRTVLDQACRSGKLSRVKHLLSLGAKIDLGDVPTLHHAIGGERLEIVKLILEQGADVNYRCAPEKILGEDSNNANEIHPITPLDYALDVFHQDSRCRDIIELLVEYGMNVNFGSRRDSPLHLACFYTNKTNIFRIQKSISRPATVRILLRHNADVNALDDKGLVPLHYVIRNCLFMRDGNPTKNPADHSKPDLVALVSSLAIKIEKKERVIEQNLVLLDNELARPIYEECVEELSLMKENICESRKFCFFDILSKDIFYLGRACKNQYIEKILDTGEYKKTFPIYAEYLEDRIREAKNRQRLADLAITSFQKYINRYILVELRLSILQYFNLGDLKNFAKACFVSVD